MRKGGLLDRQKRPHFIATWAYDANRTRKNQEQEIARAGEGYSRSRHQNGTNNKHAPPPDPIGASSEVKGDDSIADQRQGKKHARLGLAQSQANKIENQHYRQRAVSEQSYESSEE